MAAPSTCSRLECDQLFNMQACNLSGASFVLAPDLYIAQRLAHPTDIYAMKCLCNVIMLCVKYDHHCPARQMPLQFPGHAAKRHVGM